MTKALILLLAGLALACNPAAETREQATLPNQYFSVDSLLEIQQDRLLAQSYRLIKEARFDEKNNQDTLRLDSLSLAKELQILHELELNEPSLRNQYQVSRQQRGDTLELLYQTSKPDKIGVNYLKVLLLGDQPLLLEGNYSQKNYLYTSKRSIEGYFDRQGLLRGIRVDGKQKMIFRSPVNYRIVSHFITN